jgi:DNA invertase Pin-like site-specific DNA recombinase
MVEAYCARLGLTLADDRVYKDLGRSGTGRHREGQLGELLADIRSGKLPSSAVLLVEAVDRLSRENPYDALDLFKQITKSGIDIVTLEDEAIYTYDNIDQTIWQLIGKITGAYAFSKNLSRRVGDTWAIKKKLAVEGIPHGKSCVGWLRLSQDRKSYEIIPDRAAIVLRIFCESVGGDGKEKIVKRFNQEGVPTFTKQAQGIAVRDAEPHAWYTSTIHKILTNRAVLGEYQPSIKNMQTKKAFKERQIERKERQLPPSGDSAVIPDGETILNYYPQVISFDLWNSAEEARKSRAGTGGPKGQRIANLLSGLCTCKHCGAKMIFRDKGSRQYLQCFEALRASKKCAFNGGIRYQTLETAILNRLAWMDKNGLLNAKPDDSGDALAEEIDHIKSAIDAATKRRDKLSSEFDPAEFHLVRPMLLAVAREIDQLEHKKADLEKQARKAAPTVSIQDHAAALAALRSQADASDYRARLRISTALRALITKIICDPETKVVNVHTVTPEHWFSVRSSGITIHCADNPDLVLVMPGQKPQEGMTWRPLTADEVEDDEIIEEHDISEE